MATKKPSKQDKEAAQRLAENEPTLSRKARVRLGELLAESEPQRLVSGSMLYEVRGGSTHGSEIESFGEAAPRILRRVFGQEIDVDPSKLKKFCLEAEVFEIVGLFMGARRTCGISLMVVRSRIHRRGERDRGSGQVPALPGR